MKNKFLPVFVGAAVCSFAALAPPTVCPETTDNPALQRASYLLCQLGWPQLSSAERIQFQQQYWNLLAETGPEFTAYGSITGGPITTVSPTNMPSVSSGVNIAPSATAWSNTGTTYLPTNDWFENIASHPTVNTDTDDGFHRMLVATNGFKFTIPLKFSDWGTDLHSMIQVASSSQSFTLGAVGYAKPFTLLWNNQDTGNLVRKAVYDSAFSVYLSQGTLFKGASYNGATPDLGFTFTSSMKSTLSDGTVKYKVVKSNAIYLFYANSQFVPGMPYTGNVNVVVFPNDTNAAAMETLCDAHANAVVVQGQATLLPSGTYSFQYLCQDLNGNATAAQPLILLKAHQVPTLLASQANTDTGLSLLAITGPIEVYVGSTFAFQPRMPRSVDPAPNLPNGNAPLTQAQAMALCASGADLDQEISRILSNFKSSSTVYNGGKVDLQIALTLCYGAKALSVAGLPMDKVMPLYQRLRTILANKLNLFQYDTQYSGIVAKTGDYGNHSDYNDHIVQYCYDLMSFAILKAFEDQYIPANQRLMNTQVTMAGYTSYTYSDIADLLAADIGELSHMSTFFPVMRNFDTYMGHSWLSGLGSKNTESESEATFGAWSVAYWLKVRGASNDKYMTALTRYAIEISALNTYYHIGDPTMSAYTKVAPVFASSHPVVSIIWTQKLGDETYWGLNWDRIMACEFMPATANTMDSMLDFEPAFIKRAADYILANWSNFDTGNTIQATLIPIVSKMYGTAQAGPLIDDVLARNMFDGGTNNFILRYITYYADNQLNAQ